MVVLQYLQATPHDLGHSHDNLKLFFDELTSSLSKASESYENFIVIEDFNIEVTNKGTEFDELDEFSDLFN